MQMNKARKQFVVYASAALFVLLAVLVLVVNIVNYTAATQDADRITSAIAEKDGELGHAPETEKHGRPGPDSPETRASIRYFTFRFDKKKNAEKVAFNVSALSEDEARRIAAGLVKENAGWTNSVYRYRVYRHDGFDYVTVIDYGHELLQVRRTLAVSVICAAAVMAVSVIFLIFIGKKVFKPLEDADRKQRNFIKEAENDLKIPLTVIAAETEALEIKNGSDEHTKSINRQVKKLADKAKQLHELSILEADGERERCDLTTIVLSAADKKRTAFAGKGLTFEVFADPGVTVDADAAALNGIVNEALENALKFALSRASVSLKKEEESVRFTVENDTDLTQNGIEQIFDRFTRLENAAGKPGSGLGLSYVREAVKAHNGRLSAAVENGVFSLRISF